MITRKLKGGSIDVIGTAEWKAALKIHGYTQEGSLRGSHPHVYAFDRAGNRVGEAGHGGHGGLTGFVSPSPEAFKIDWIDDVERVKEVAALVVQGWVDSTPEQTCLGDMHATIVQRHVDGLPETLRRMDQCIASRMEELRTL